jgi:hypothetical protein
MTPILVGVWNWFASKALPWIAALCQELLRVVCPFFLPVIRVSIFSYTVAMGLWALITWAWSRAWALLQEVLATDFPRVQGNLIVYYDFINRLVPLSETIATSIIVFNIWAAVVVIRWIKSIIPTLSN